MIARRIGVGVWLAVAACAPPPPPPSTPVPTPSPAPVESAPVAPPTITIVLNARALREGGRTRRAVVVTQAFLPIEERDNEVEWLAVDGPSPLGEPTKNVVFVQTPGAPLRVEGDKPRRPIAPPRAPRGHELVLVHVRTPKEVVRVPHFQPSDTILELSLVAEARTDGGADLHLRERCTSATEAAKAAASLDATIERWNSGGVGIVTGGLFADAKASVDGTDARLDIQASPEQVETLAELATTLVR